MDDVKRVNLVDKYLKYPVKLLYWFGLWRMDDHPFMYSIYSFSVLFSTQYLFTICQIIYMVNVWGDIAKIAEASFFLLTQATLCVKILIFLWKSNNIRRLAVYMNCAAFAPTRAAHLPFINSSSSVQTAEFFVFLFMATLTVSLWAIFPLIDPAEERILPFKAWHPFPNEHTPYYEVIYVYQITSIWFSALVTAAMDRLSTSMTALGCAQVQILKDNLINIEVYAKHDLEKSLQEKNKDDPRKIEGMVNFAVEMNLFRGNYIQSRQLEVEAIIQRSLVKNILHHKSICRFMYQMEECFHVGILTQFAASVLIICITGLQISLIKPASLKFASRVTYLGAMLAQIFFTCRIGTEITVDSGELVLAAYTCPWIERKRRFNTTLLIFMERLKQPIIPRAGYLFPLSLQTFVSILRSSYSYFAVLQRLNSDK